MRATVWIVTLVLVMIWANILLAQEAPQTIEPMPVTGDEISAPTTASEQLRPEPLIPGPPLPIPSPALPSEPPEDYVPPIVEPVPDLATDVVEMTAEQLRTTFEEGEPVLTIGTGNVIIRFRNVIVTGGQGQYEHRTGLATLTDNVVFRYDTQEVAGQAITLNARTGAWEFAQADTTVRPEFMRGVLFAPVFAEAESIQGRGREFLTVLEADTTTCNLPHPHYELVTRSMTVYPGNKIIFRNVTAYILGRRLFTLPRLVIPLRDLNRNPRIIPRFGQTVEEGTFLKTSYNYFGNRNQTGLLLLDLMTRKGIGHGIKHTYEFAQAGGELELYNLYDRDIGQNMLTGRLDHTQRFGTLVFNAASNLRKNSYFYAPDSTSWNNRITLTRDRPTANSSFTLTQNINDTFIRTQNLAGTLRHRQRFGTDAFFDSSMNYTAFDSTIGRNARLQSQLFYEKRGDKFDWNISAQELTDLSDEAFVGRGRFGGIEKLPEIALITETARLGRILPVDIPARMKLTFGRFNELPANTELDRTFLEVISPVRRYKLSDSWTLAAGSGFRQYFYSDDTAQYAVDSSADLSKRLGQRSSLALTYRYQRPRGFTPFRFDYIGRYNIANLRLNLEDSQVFKLSLLTGYDFERANNPWRDITLRSTVQPSPSFLLYTATSYDINRSEWRTLINQIRIRGGETFKLDIGSRYDPTRGRLASLRTWLDTPLGSQYRIQALAGYNGFTRDFDYRSVMLTRDLHCWEASVVFVDQGGFYRERGIYVNFRIKAFPLFTNYGVGQFGQALDTSVGQVY